MDALAVHTGPLKIVAQALAHMLGVAENDHPLIALAPNQPQAGFFLGKGRDSQAVLVDVGPVFPLGLHGDLYLVTLIHPAYRHDLLRDGSGEQSQILFVLDFVQNFGDILKKAHIQHPVRFVQHHGLDLIQTDGFAVVVVHQTAGRGNHDLGLLFQLFQLTADAGTAVKHGNPDALEVSQQSSELITDLNGQLPGRGKDQGLNGILLGIDVLDHGNAEGEGLAGAGGGFGDHILPLHERRNGLLLNRGGITVSLLFQGLEHGFAQTEILESNHSIFHL